MIAKLYKLVFAPQSVENALKGLNAAIRKLEKAQRQHSELAARKVAQATALRLQTEQHDREAENALRVANKIKELVA